MMRRTARTVAADTVGTPVNPAYTLLHTGIDEAMKQVSVPQPIPDEAIHDARKALKKARAALRLLQDGMSKATYQLENSELRDAGRFLSPFRDAKSLIDAFDALHDRYRDRLQDTELAPLRKILHANLTKARRHFSRTPIELENYIRLLRGCIARAARKDFGSINSKAVTTGLRRIYRKGCNARAEAKAVRTPEAFHEWRKQVKYLLNATDALHLSRKGNASKRLKWTDHLADCLGYDHDLAMLSQETARGAYAPVDADVIKALHALIARRRAKLQKRAFGLGEKVYDRKPGKFVGMILKHARLPPTTSSTRKLHPGATLQSSLPVKPAS
ncbi:CHAD domain-containing protein [Nitrosospira sp. Nl5]|uniref:CHAD domain-containing protein n=1 Tax=Nitrosospira sp. Nl5 TaxID=200120 RepID=UPI000884020A|nr:CHAD domain-containing protein [Nitrosospira sp. Nl5]SCY63379.1 CHAD domain-containing protein [Nitrosospira sp. Nl5]